MNLALADICQIQCLALLVHGSSASAEGLATDASRPGLVPGLGEFLRLPKKIRFRQTTTFDRLAARK
jgi:hypothetical protein